MSTRPRRREAAESATRRAMPALVLGRLLPALLLLVAGCEGDNLFRDPGTGLATDRRAPEVTIEAPVAGQRVAVGDSVLVRVRVEDDQAIASVELAGFVLRGSAELGTLTRVPRFDTKTIDLETVRPVVRDTLLSRYLLATAEDVAEDLAFIVATVRDFGGNEVADTVRIGIGGPRAAILTPLPGTEVRAGGDLRVRVTAADTADLLQSVRLLVEGGMTADTMLRLDPPRATLDTVLTFVVPADVPAGDLHLRAVARNTLNDSTASPVVSLRLLGAAQDTQAPTVRFRVTTPPRAERSDSVSVTVTATDETRLESVGVTLVPIHRRAVGTDTLTVLSFTQPADSATFRVSLAALGAPLPTDTSTLRLEITAFALDAAGNCATSTVPNTTLSEACAPGQPVLGVRSGARFEILLVRGQTIPVGGGTDRIADLAANSTHLFLSNLTRNRLEVVPIGATAVSDTIAVGSRPWGLAFDRAGGLLYVANSGGTNISVVSPALGAEVDRIQTPNVKLFDVPFDATRIPDPADPTETDSVTALIPESVTRYDYSDRPQFIGVTQNENLVFSTQPTAAARDGTLRILRRPEDRLEIITDYAEERIGLRVVIANADSAFLVPGSPNNVIMVCPRNRSANPDLDGNLPSTCRVGPVNFVQAEIEAAGYDTRFLYGMDIQEIGLTDTTFVAVSGDHSTIAFGEGARENARVVTLTEPAGQGGGALIRFGETKDLVGNVAERVIGLALNADGSLGLARGREAYFFSRDLRLQGFVDTETIGGGVEMHPDNPPERRAFVSGVQADGLAFIDVMDTFHFRRVARIFLRDPVTGPVRAVRAADGALMIYAVTRGGLVAIDVSANDL